jgi:peptidoglycan/LPS O-acetylase OafA/YrhL
MINIQILRFLAAFVVVLHHVRASFLNLVAYKAGLAWRFVVDNGFWGVDIFFVISGAIMAHSIRDLSDDDQTALRFAVTRFARIFSGWWPFFVLYLAMYWFIGTLDQRNLVASFLLMPQSLDSSLLPITWTLSFDCISILVLLLLLHAVS